MTRLAEDQKQVTDEMLMVRYQRGRRDAFATLVSRYASTIFSVGYYLLGSETQADKLAQDTFIQVVREAATFNLEAQFRAWIFGIFHRIASESYSSQIEGLEEERDFATATTDSSPSDTAPPSSRAYRSQLLTRRVANRVTTLPFAVREAFLFKQSGQLSMSDIAVATGTDIDTARRLLRSAFDRIQDSVADTEDYARALR